jgi:hypothetical protein
MLLNPAVLGATFMPTVHDDEQKRDKNPTTNIRVRVEVKEAIDDIIEATGQKQWEVIDELLAASLPGAQAAAKAFNAKIKSEKARVEKLQEEARKKIWG